MKWQAAMFNYLLTSLAVHCKKCHVTCRHCPACSCEEIDVPDEFTIQPYEVFDALSRVNVYKSPGPDDLPNWFLRDFAFVITEPVCHIFNASISTGIMPSLWKRANVVPLPKVHPPKSIHDDLRPISLTPTLSKLLELLVGRRLLPSIIEKFDSRQFGALRGRSTTHALIAVTHMWHQALDDPNSIGALFSTMPKHLTTSTTQPYWQK
jgi:hypothetical protein